MDKAGTLRRLLAELTSLFPRPTSVQEKHMLFREKMRRDIAQEGFFVMAVFGSDTTPAFTYTIGLTETFKHPELLIFGLPVEYSHHVMNDAVSRIKRGAVYGDGDLIKNVLVLPLAVRSVSMEKADEYTVQLFNYYRHQLTAPRVVQLVLPDTKGRFPWHADFEEHLRTMQPALWEMHH